MHRWFLAKFVDWLAWITCPRHKKLLLNFFFWHVSNSTNPIQLLLCCNIDHARGVQRPKLDDFVGYLVGFN